MVIMLKMEMTIMVTMVISMVVVVVVKVTMRMRMSGWRDDSVGMNSDGEVVKMLTLATLVMPGMVIFMNRVIMLMV